MSQVTVTPTSGMPSQYRRIGYKRQRVSRYSARSLPFHRAVPRGIRNNAALIYKFKRSTLESEHTQTYPPGTLGGQPFELSVTLNTLPGFTELTSLFDCYRVTYCKWHFLNPNTVQDSPTTPFYLHTAIDQNDSIAAASVDQLRQFQSYRMKNLSTGSQHTIGYKPGYDVRNDGAQQIYQNRWLNTADPTTVWNGLKCIVEVQGPASTAERILKIYSEVWIEFKAVK